MQAELAYVLSNDVLGFLNDFINQPLCRLFPMTVQISRTEGKLHVPRCCFSLRVPGRK